MDPLTSLLIGALLLFLFSLLFWPKGGLLGYLQRVSQLNLRIQVEDTLKYLFHSEGANSPPAIAILADALKTNTNRMEKILDDMQDNELVTLSKDGIRLTNNGRQYALRIIRAHRLWERYLSEETGYAETSWHELAERYEHQLTPEQVEILASQLGQPTHDPHGDPIPTANGEYIAHKGLSLNKMPVHTPLQIVHIEDEPETIYAQLVAEGLHPGMQIQITKKTPERINFWANGEEHILAPIFTESISVRTIKEEAHPLVCTGRPLHALKPGQSGVVLSLSPRLRGVERRRMMDLGILPGTIISAEMTSPAGDPTAYRIRGALVALRKEQAGLICIQNPEEMPA